MGPMGCSASPVRSKGIGWKAVVLCGIATATAWLVSGCGSSSAPVASQPATISGRVSAGLQPVAGASVMLYAAGLSGDGAGATALMTAGAVTTDASGNFGIPASSYTCPASSAPVYLVAQGGTPGGVSTRNGALEFVAAIGSCGNLAANFTYVNDVSTVAAAWSLSQFTGNSAQIGAKSTNLSGLQNAFGIAATLSNLVTGTAPGASLPKGTTTETAKLNMLANALAKCSTSDGTTNCQALFAAAAVAGVAPSNTFDAALNIVRNPGTSVASVFAAAPTSGAFQPSLAAAPNDWTMSIKYGACTSGCGGLNLPGGLAIDSTGNVWVANYFGAAVSKFSPAGVAVSATGFAGSGLYESYGIAVDGSDNAWVANEQSVSAAANSRVGSISKFSPTGTELSGSGYTGGGVYYPLAIAATSNGSMWVADYGSSSATLLSSAGTALSGSGGFASSQLPFTAGVAVDASQNGWFATQTGVARVTTAGALTPFPCCANPEGIAIDPSGNVWVADYGAFAVVELSSAGKVAATLSTASSASSPHGIAVDGAGNVWTANYLGNTITSITGSTATVRSPNAGFGLDASLNEPYGIAIDGSGNLWVSNAGDSTLTEIVGMATPVKTPLVGPPSQP